MLEPYEVKVSRAVLRGLWAGNSPWLPDTAQSRRFLAQLFKFQSMDEFIGWTVCRR
ncbi:hypothetical protein GMMP13_450018 [Candidatus Magnetomoraceae bacterium gMMP-13]